MITTKKRQPVVKKEYAWREDSRFSIDPQEVGEALEKLSTRLGKPEDGLTAEDVVEAAKDARFPLHDVIFGTDDADAAHEHRKNIARQVMRSIRVTVIQEAGEKQAIAYVHVRVPDVGPMYVPTNLAASRKDLRIQMLEDAQKGINGWFSRYKNLEGISELSPLVDELSSAIQKQIRVVKASKEQSRLVERAR